MTWATPQLFLLFIPLLLAAGYFWFRGNKKIPTVQFSHLGALKSLKSPLRAKLSILPNVLKITALILIVVALARPQIANTKVKKNVEGIDIILTLDISDSMLIEDMTPENRMEAAKKTIREFVENRVSDRIALTVFSGEAYTRVPLTLDYKLLQESIAQIQPSRNIKMGTAIGVALANAVSRLKDSTAKSRVIILLTDGENNSGTIAPETALEIAKSFGIKVYTIGIGQDGQSQLPVYATDVFGRKIKTYQPIHSAVNDTLLTQIAEETGGKYYRAVHTKALEKVFSDINRLEKTKIDVNKFTKYKEQFQDFLFWAVILYFASIFLNRTWLRRVP